MMLDELEKLAKAATPGPWTDVECRVECGSYCQGGSGVLFIDDTESNGIRSRWDDLEFIAAANPETVLKLIAVARAAKEQDRDQLKTGKYNLMLAQRVHKALAALEETKC